MKSQIIIPYMGSNLRCFTLTGTKRFSKSIWKPFKVEFKEIEESLIAAKDEVMEELQLTSEQAAYNFRRLLTTEIEENRMQRLKQAADMQDVASPETYIGYERAQNFASPGGLDQEDVHLYQAPADLKLNQWAFAGNWKDAGQIAASLTPSSSIVYRFHARDLHLVLGPSKDGKPIRFRVTLDGKAPGADHGVDTDADGYGTVTEDRLYQLIRQKGSVQDRTFRIEFVTPGVQAYSFTFG